MSESNGLTSYQEQALDNWIVENGQRQEADERDMGDDDE